MAQTGSRPMRSESAPSAIWPGMPARLTRPRAQAAWDAEIPMPRRYLVWCTCTAYQAYMAVALASASHQKRGVASARARVQSVAAQAGSTMWTVLRARAWVAVSPSGVRPRSAGWRRIRRFSGTSRIRTRAAKARQAVRQPAAVMIAWAAGSSRIEPMPAPA